MEMASEKKASNFKKSLLLDVPHDTTEIILEMLHGRENAPVIVCKKLMKIVKRSPTYNYDKVVNEFNILERMDVRRQNKLVTKGKIIDLIDGNYFVVISPIDFERVIETILFNMEIFGEIYGYFGINIPEEYGRDDILQLHTEILLAHKPIVEKVIAIDETVKTAKIPLEYRNYTYAENKYNTLYTNMVEYHCAFIGFMISGENSLQDCFDEENVNDRTLLSTLQAKNLCAKFVVCQHKIIGAVNML
jgi:hypothetical protein